MKNTVGGTAVYNVYDASGRLVHVHIPSQGNKRTDYIHVAGMTLNRIEHGGLITALHNDHLGSIGVGTDGNTGDVVWEERYTQYGEALIAAAANDNQGGFTGHIKDAATGLNYMQARYYDPVMGRFLSVDPVGFLDTGKPGMFNRYAYTFNNPINMIDPDGKMGKSQKRRPPSSGALEKARADLEAFRGDRSAEGMRKFKAAKRILDSNEKFTGERNAQKRKTEFKRTKSLGKGAKGGLLGLALAITANPADELLEETEAALAEPQEVTVTITGCTGDCDQAEEWGWIIADPENNKPHSEPKPKPKEEEVGT